MGRPLALLVTGGNTNYCTQFTAVMEAIRVPRIGPGRPRVRPAHIVHLHWLRRLRIRWEVRDGIHEPSSL